MAQVAITGLALDKLSESHWLARSFFFVSLISGLLSVYYAMHQLRILGKLITTESVKDWLRAPIERVFSRDKNRPSISAVLILDTPRGLVNISVVSFVIALSIYVVFVFVNKLDTDAGENDSRNVLITFFVSLWLCMALYSKANLFDYYAGRHRDWLDIVLMWISILEILSGDFTDPDEELPTHSVNKPNNSTRLDANGNLPAGSVLLRVGDGTSDDSERDKAVTTDYLKAVLDEAINARRRCLEADERFVKALELYRDGRVN